MAIDQITSGNGGAGRGQTGVVVPLGSDVPDLSQRPARGYPTHELDLEARSESGFDLAHYIRFFLKYKTLIGGTIGGFLLLGFIVTFLMTPVYRAVSTIQIDRDAMDVVDVKGVQPQDNSADLEFYQTQYQLLGSLSLAERVVNMTALVDNPAFSNKGQVSLLGLIKSLIRGSDPATAPSDLEARTRQVAQALQSSLSINPVRGSRIVNIGVDSTSPGLAQQLANAYADAFIADNLDRRFDATSYARKFLEDRLVQLKAKLEDSEKQLVKYAEKQGIINLDDKSTLTTNDLAAFNSKLSDARGARMAAEAKWKAVQGSSGVGIQEVLDNKNIQDNVSNLTSLKAQYQQKLAVFKPAYPDMMQLQSQIKELERQIQDQIAAIKNAIEATYLQAKDQEDQLSQQLEQLKADVVEQRNRSIQYNILQREVDTNRSLYDGLLQRYKEIGVAGAVGSNNISIVDRAEAPGSPRVPKLWLNLAIALLGGLMVGSLAALGLDHLDDSFKTPEDLESETGIPVIGIIPKPKLGVSVEDEMREPRSGMAEAIRSLRTGLQFATSEGLPKVLLVTSSKPSEGKTTTTISLARSLAHIGLNVLLIDGDLRNASVHKRVHCSNERGLSNYLTGANHPEEVIQGTDTNGLTLIASGPLPPNPAELLSGPRLALLLSLARESFDIVLIDGPPVMGLADSPLLSSIAQATMVVVAANETRRDTVRVALRRLQFARANIIGALLNKFDVKQTGYGYGYGYGDYEYHSYGTKELTGPSEAA